MTYVRDEGGVRLRALGLAVAVICLGICLVQLSPGVQDLLGLVPPQVLILHLREENSTGLMDLPPPGSDSGPVHTLDGGRLLLPADAGPVPVDTRVLIIRETYASGARLETRVIYLPRLPAVIDARGPDGIPLSPDAALLAVDVTLDHGGSAAGAGSVVVLVPGVISEAVSSDAPGPVLPGHAWRIAAVRADGSVRVLSPDDAGYEDAIRAAFAEGRQVSLLCLTNHGFISADMIELASGSEG